MYTERTTGGEPVDVGPLYAEALRAWGPSALPPAEMIRVTIEPQMTRNFERAYPKAFHRHTGQKVSRDYYAITLSGPWFCAIQDVCGEQVLLEQWRDTVLHELAHISIYHTRPGSGIHHGYEWQRLMQKVGLPTCARAFYPWSYKVALPGTKVTWAQIASYKEDEHGGDS